jgi:hypothetical protein
VSLNRPVLVRQAAADGSTDDGGWDVEMLNRLFGAQQLHSVNVPYAQMFVGGRHSETTLPDFLGRMESGALDPEALMDQQHYIFQTVSPAQEDVLRRTAASEDGYIEVLQGAKLKAATRPGKVFCQFHTCIPAMLRWVRNIRRASVIFVRGADRRQVPALHRTSWQWLANSLAQRRSQLRSAWGKIVDVAASAACSLQQTARY